MHHVLYDEPFYEQIYILAACKILGTADRNEPELKFPYNPLSQTSPPQIF